jgi:hypothetical protein
MYIKEDFKMATNTKRFRSGIGLSIVLFIIGFAILAFASGPYKDTFGTGFITSALVIGATAIWEAYVAPPG